MEEVYISPASKNSKKIGVPNVKLIRNVCVNVFLVPKTNGNTAASSSSGGT